MLWFKHKKDKAVGENRLGVILKQELSDFIKRDELQGYLAEIEKDKKKKELWDSLPAQKKIKVLRYVMEKKGTQNAKK